MLALSLFLSAAAGVNAILGGEVRAVKISETSYICADDCAYEGVFFAHKGHFCPEKETTIRVNAKGKAHFFAPYDCTGGTLPSGYSERQRSNGEEPPKCDVKESDDSENECTFSKMVGGGKAGKTIQWSDVEKELKSATSEDGQGTPKESQPAAPKTQQQYAEIGKQMFQPDDTALPNDERADTRVFNAEAMTKLCKLVQFTREQCQSLHRTCFAKAPRVDDDEAQKQLQACAFDFIQKQSAYAKTETPQNGPGQNTSKAPVRSDIVISMVEDISISEENALREDLIKIAEADAAKSPICYKMAGPTQCYLSITAKAIAKLEEVKGFGVKFTWTLQ